MERGPVAPPLHLHRSQRGNHRDRSFQGRGEGCRAQRPHQDPKALSSKLDVFEHQSEGRAWKEPRLPLKPCTELQEPGGRHGEGKRQGLGLMLNAFQQPLRQHPPVGGPACARGCWVRGRCQASPAFMGGNHAVPLR